MTHEERASSLLRNDFIKARCLMDVGVAAHYLIAAFQSVEREATIRAAAEIQAGQFVNCSPEFIADRILGKVA